MIRAFYGPTDSQWDSSVSRWGWRAQGHGHAAACGLAGGVIADTARRSDARSAIAGPHTMHRGETNTSRLDATKTEIVEASPAVVVWVRGS